ncbi:MAG: 23S rRNA (adenine(2503)-C(2))-methyltransferase RlmN [Gemmatimonadetes bacterium]|nr:23S rRNA (adenine(2503)-C(2))-methyltransferase RlmN [Gemmatimonadota bacterium]
MPNTSSKDLLSMTPEGLRHALSQYFEQKGLPAYRVGQVEKWIYKSLTSSIDQMTDVPLTERRDLCNQFSLIELRDARIARSKDGTVKHVWQLSDGKLVESVLIPTRQRLTLCISSQAGCALGCTFCATGWGGFERQLSAGEIVSQYRASRRWAEGNGYGPITNIVYMGMGEPLANLGAVHDSLTILNQGYKVGARRITVSTVGVVPGILELARRPEQFGLALSLHAPLSKLREELIPLEKRYPLPEVIEALSQFQDSGGKRITYEYTMIRGVNDDPELIRPLANLANRVRAFVNLIPYNPIPYQAWHPSSAERIHAFAKGLTKQGVSVAVRETRGSDIDAACGQLRAHALEKRASDVTVPQDSIN